MFASFAIFAVAIVVLTVVIVLTGVKSVPQGFECRYNRIPRPSGIISHG